MYLLNGAFSQFCLDKKINKPSQTFGELLNLSIKAENFPTIWN